MTEDEALLFDSTCQDYKSHWSTTVANLRRRGDLEMWTQIFDQSKILWSDWQRESGFEEIVGWGVDTEAVRPKQGVSCLFSWLMQLLIGSFFSYILNILIEPTYTTGFFFLISQLDWWVASLWGEVSWSHSKNGGMRKINGSRRAAIDGRPRAAEEEDDKRKIGDWYMKASRSHLQSKSQSYIAPDSPSYYYSYRATYVKLLHPSYSIYKSHGLKELSAVPPVQQLGLVEQRRSRNGEREERPPSDRSNRIQNIDDLQRTQKPELECSLACSISPRFYQYWSYRSQTPYAIEKHE